MTATPRPTLAEMPLGTLLHPADLYRVLDEACAAAGGQSAWAKRHGLSRQQVSDAVRARRDPSPAVLHALDAGAGRADMKLCIEGSPEMEGLRADVRRLRTVIDSRPAINTGLPETYVQWSRPIYLMEFTRATERTS